MREMDKYTKTNENNYLKHDFNIFQAELDLRMLVKLLPEGVIILNTRTRTIQLINSTAIKLFKPEDEIDPKYDLKILGAPTPATH